MPWVRLNADRREIRLLDLEPLSRGPDKLSCNLRVASLDDEPKYEALSYVWGGKADPPHALCVGGQELHITRNLYEALYYLREDDTARTLWVDAVCINQIDNEERSSQVSMMGDIYKKTKEVLVWLGSDDLSQDMVRDIRLHASDTGRHFIRPPPSPAMTRTKDSWWQRVWTLQEAVLGPSLTFWSGKERCYGFQLEIYYHCLIEHFIPPNACCQPLINDNYENMATKITFAMEDTLEVFQNRRTYQDQPKDLLRLALQYRGRYATDPRDKIFALIGMANSSSVPLGLVQYGTPLLQAMVDTTSKLLQHTNTLEVVRHALDPLFGEEDDSEHDQDSYRAKPHHAPPRLRGLPSWCPDWTQDIPAGILSSMSSYRRDMHGRFRAGMSHPANAVFNDDHSLGLTGIKCDRVMHVGYRNQFSPTHWQNNLLLVAEILAQWCYMVANSLSHSDAVCDGCDRRIYGARFKCSGCEDFDFCFSCMQEPPVSHAVEHVFKPVYLRGCQPQPSGEDWSEFMGLARLRNDQLHTAPDVYVRRERNGSFRVVGSPWDHLKKVDSSYPFTNGDSLQDAFRRTLLGDRAVVLDGTPLSALEQVATFEELFVWLMEYELRKSIEFGGTDSKYSQEEVMSAFEKPVLSLNGHYTFTHIMRSMLERSRMVVSAKGYIGIAPAGTKVGDHICVLHGGEMPFILRERSADDKSELTVGEDFVLVGEAYVHGLMNGEAISAADAGELQRVHITLH